jgi:hypothetical protein
VLLYEQYDYALVKTTPIGWGLNGRTMDAMDAMMGC